MADVVTEMADEWVAEIRALANQHVDMVMETNGVTLTAAERDGIEIGIDAGLTAATQVFVRKGLLPSEGMA